MRAAQVHEVIGLVQRLHGDGTVTGNEKRMSAQQPFQIDGRARMYGPDQILGIETVLFQRLSPGLGTDSGNSNRRRCPWACRRQ